MLRTSLVRTAAPAFGQRAASTIALKYSKAVFGAALSKSPQTLTKVHADLTAVATTISSSPDIHAFVTNPTLSQNDRAAGLKTLFSKLDAGKKAEPTSEITKNLLAVLSENGRLGETEGVIEGFNELFAEYKGELTVTVTSATPLAKDVLARLESSLKSSQTAQAAKLLKIENKVRYSGLYQGSCS